MIRPYRGQAAGGGFVRLALTLLILLWPVFWSATATAQTPLRFPPLSGRVVDEARLLSPAKEQEIADKLAALETRTGDQLVVVTLTSLQDREIEDYGYQLGRAWGLGQKTNDGGVLLIVAPEERKVRIEVGYGLEPVLTDALSTRIIQNDILPAFRVGGFERGISTGVDAIIAQLTLDPAEAQARAEAAAVEPDPIPVPVGPIVLVALVFAFILIGLMGATRGGGGRRRRSDLGSVLVWTAAEALRNSGRSGGWSGGGGFGGGGFGGGGGFSGGGGSFGGGGASGGW